MTNKNILSRIIALLLFAVLTLIFFSPYLYNNEFIGGISGDFRKFMIDFYRYSDYLKKGMIPPFWNQFVMGGGPAFPNSTGFLYLDPFTLIPLCLFGVKTAYNVSMILIITCSGFFMYLFVEKLRLRVLSCYFAGIVYAFSFLVIDLASAGQIMSLTFLPYVPLVLYLMKVFFESRNKVVPAVLIILSIGFHFFSFTLYWFNCNILYGMYFLFLVMHDSGWNRKKIFTGILSLFFIYCGVLGFISILLLPTMQLVLNSCRTLNFPPRMFFWGSVHPLQLLSFFSADYILKVNPLSNALWTRSWMMHIYYCGFFSIFALIMAGICRRKIKETSFWFFVLVLFNILSLSYYGYIGRFLCYLPVFSKFRTPSRFNCMVYLSLAVLVAIGFDHFCKLRDARIYRRLLLYSSIFISVGVLLFLLVPVFFVCDQGVGYVWENQVLRLLLLAGICYALIGVKYWQRNKRYVELVNVGIVMFICIEMFSMFFNEVKRKQLAIKNASSIDKISNTKTAEYFRHRKGLYRVCSMGWKALDAGVYIYSPVLLIPDVSGASHLILKNYRLYTSYINEDLAGPYSPWTGQGLGGVVIKKNPQSKLLDLLNVRYIIFNKNDIQENSNYYPRFLYSQNYVVKNSNMVLYDYKVKTYNAGAILPIGKGHVGQRKAGEVVQMRLPVPTQGKIVKYDIPLKNVLAYYGSGNSYCLLIYKDCNKINLLYKGKKCRTATQWNRGNARSRIDISSRITKEDQKRGFIDIYYTAQICGDHFTLLKHNKATPLEANIKVVTECRQNGVVQKNIPLDSGTDWRTANERIRVVRNEVLEALASQSYDPYEQVIFDKKPEEKIELRNKFDKSLVSKAEIKVLKYGEDRIILEVCFPDNGILLISNSFYPEWRAHVDGKKRNIYRANYMFQALFVEKGKHRVEIFYIAEMFKYGLIITVCTILLFVILIITSLLRSKRKIVF